MNVRAALSLCVLGGCSEHIVVLQPNGDGGSNGNPLLDASTVVDGGLEPGFDAAFPPAVRAHSLSAFDHSCATLGGALYCWGQNTFGQVGVGDDAPRLVPTLLGDDRDYVEVCAGEAHGCALHGDGSVACWGKNLHGELGLGDFDARKLPTKLGDLRFVRIACGGYNTCGLAADGALFCWGDNFEGKVGQADSFQSPDIPRPARVANELRFYEVSVGQGHVCAVARDGELYCWGRNTDGQLGIGSDEPQLRAPRRVGMESDYRHVASGQRHSCAIKRDGRLFCWGTDSFGSLGIGADNETLTRVPMQVGTQSDYRDVRLNWFHTCALRDGGLLSCWGRNDEGQLGLGDLKARSTPARVGTLEGWSALTVGHFHTCAFRNDELFCWGENNENGQLGLGMPGRKNEPARVTIP